MDEEPIVFTRAALSLVMDAAIRVERQRIVDAIYGELARTSGDTGYGKAKTRQLRWFLTVVGDGVDDSGLRESSERVT
jgi:hypothetical protein